MGHGTIDLSADKARIFRITHRRNIPFIAANGIHCAEAGIRDPLFVPIGNADLIAKRKQRDLPAPCTGTMASYIPFYFTPLSVMLLNIVTGRNVAIQNRKDIVVLVSSLPRLQNLRIPFVFSDRHAYLAQAMFSNNIADLDRIDWDILRRREFRRDADDPERFDRYQAEALVKGHLPVEGLLGAVCYTDDVVDEIGACFIQAGHPLRVIKRREWFF